MIILLRIDVVIDYTKVMMYHNSFKGAGGGPGRFSLFDCF